jgi:biotin carboxyl carrier protein
MKMEIPMESEYSGQVKEVLVLASDEVVEGQVLVLLASDAV